MTGNEFLKDYIHPTGYAKMKGLSMSRVTQLMQEGKLRTIDHYGRRLIYIGEDHRDETAC